MGNRLHTLWLLLLLTSHLANAQNFGRIYHAYIGYERLNTTVVNNWLPVNLAYPSMKNSLVSFGVDGYAIQNNFLIGGQLQLKRGPVAIGTGGNIQPYIVDLMAQGGYVFMHKNGLMLYSTIGVGYGAFGAHIFNTRKKYPEFVPSGAASRENVVLIQQGFVGSLAVGADYFVSHHDMNRSQGFAIGLRVGYDARPQSNKWQANADAIANGPSYSASGAFVRLTIGKGSIGVR